MQIYLFLNSIRNIFVKSKEHKMTSLKKIFIGVLLCLGYNVLQAQETITLIAISDTVIEGDTVKVDIIIGSESNPVEGINNIELDIAIDSTHYQFNKIIFQNFSNNFFGTEGTDYTFELDTTALDSSILRLKYKLKNTNINVSGTNRLGRIKLIVEDDVPGIYKSIFKITKINAQNSNNEIVNFNTTSKEVVLAEKIIQPVKTHTFNPDAIKVYPNPTREALYIENKFLSIPKIEIYDTTGEQLISTQGLVVDIAFLPKGLYLLHLIFENGSIAYKVIKE
jgi:hypothetical protein